MANSRPAPGPLANFSGNGHLNFITTEAARYPTFTLLMNAEVDDIVRVGGRVAGVRYRDVDGHPHEIRAQLTVAADGRRSAVRRAAGLRPREFGSSIDVMMFPLSREDDDPDDTFTMWMGSGHFLGVINRSTYWHIMYVIHKGGIQALRAQGLPALHAAIAGLAPFLGSRARDQVRDFDDVDVLDVTVNRLRRWHRPGLLFIGDAAHAMSPLYGVGINLAIQDAVATSNLLTGHLRRWQDHGVPLPERALGAVQRRRVLPTVATQVIQRLVQWSGIDQALRHPEREAPSVFSRVPQNRTVTRLLTRLSATGVLPEHVRTPAPGGVINPSGVGELFRG